jgi:hypothetical protein
MASMMLRHYVVLGHLVVGRGCCELGSFLSLEQATSYASVMRVRHPHITVTIGTISTFVRHQPILASCAHCGRNNVAPGECPCQEEAPPQIYDIISL